MRSYSHLRWVLTARLLHSRMEGDTPAMPLPDAHSGGFFVSDSGLAAPYLKVAAENTREGVRV